MPELNAKSIRCTDGSKQVCDDGTNVIGAGFNNPARVISHFIYSWGFGGTSTNTCTKLAAIASALLLMGQEQDEIIAADSQASICMIAKYGLSTNPAARQRQGHAGRHSNQTCWLCKNGPTH